MNTTTPTRPAPATLVMAGLAFSAAAQAAPPGRLAGTTGTLQAKRSSEQRAITAQGLPGARGARACRPLFGNLGVATVRGCYGPCKGRVHLLHQNLGTGETVRIFTGQVSDQVVGQPLYMAGSVAIANAAFGELGESNFAATP